MYGSPMMWGTKTKNLNVSSIITIELKFSFHIALRSSFSVLNSGSPAPYLVGGAGGARAPPEFGGSERGKA